MQIAGDSQQISALVSLLTEFDHATQFVLRFRHLPLAVRDIIHLREGLKALPAVCISNHFIVAMNTWAEWWPELSEVWDRPEKITGLAVFREQLDFDSMGSSATKEWLRLTADQKRVWNCEIAPMVQSLYQAAISKRKSVVAASSATATGSSMLMSSRSVSL